MSSSHPQKRNNRFPKIFPGDHRREKPINHKMWLTVQFTIRQLTNNPPRENPMDDGRKF
jgi:hypothetical protein